MAADLKKVVWSEGTILTQQHFQQWDGQLALDGLLRLQTALPDYWGIKNLIIDENALLSGYFRIKKIEAVFQNGQFISYDEKNKYELGCELQKSHNSQINLYLCLPMNRKIKGLSGVVGEENASWHAHYEKVVDQYSHDSEREVAFAIPNLSVKREDQERQGVLQIKVAEAEKNNSYQLNEKFIPPSLSIGSSTALLYCLKNLIVMLGGRAESLFELCSSDAVDNKESLHYCFQHRAVIKALYLLEIAYREKSAHPKHLYHLLSGLVGALLDTKQRNLSEILILYEHDQLAKTFYLLKERIQKLTQQKLQQEKVQILFDKIDEMTYISKEIGDEVIQAGEFYLAVRLDRKYAGWKGQLISTLKIAAPSDIQFIVSSATTGIPIKYDKQHSTNNSGENIAYFYLEKVNPYWEEIKKEKKVALFIPQKKHSLEPTLLIIKNSDKEKL